MNDDRRNRRALLAGAGAAGIAGILSGCTVYGAASPGTGSTGGGASPDAALQTARADADGDAARRRELAPTSDIPVGGGKIFADEGIVVTQPQAGLFRAFSATCTHQGCQVDSVSRGTINCPCHGSRFRIADGSVARGPAARALPGKTISVDGGRITLP